MIIQSKFGEFLESISSLLLAIQFKLENQCFSTGYVIQNIETIAINKEKNNSNDLYLQKFLSSRLAPQAIILPKLAYQ